jgi:hypothetical protein
MSVDVSSDEVSIKGAALQYGAFYANLKIETVGEEL